MRLTAKYVKLVADSLAVARDAQAPILLSSVYDMINLTEKALGLPALINSGHGPALGLSARFYLNEQRVECTHRPVDVPAGGRIEFGLGFTQGLPEIPLEPPSARLDLCYKDLGGRQFLTRYVGKHKGRMPGESFESAWKWQQKYMGHQSD